MRYTERNLGQLLAELERRAVENHFKDPDDGTELLKRFPPVKVVPIRGVRFPYALPPDEREEES